MGIGSPGSRMAGRLPGLGSVALTARAMAAQANVCQQLPRLVHLLCCARPSGHGRVRRGNEPLAAWGHLGLVVGGGLPLGLLGRAHEREEAIHQNSCNDAGVDRVSEWNHCQRQEGRDGYSQVVPVDALDGRHHEGPDQHQWYCGGDLWHCAQHGPEEGRDEEEHGDDDGREAGSGALHDPSAALVRDDHRAGPQERADDGADGCSGKDGGAPGHSTVLQQPRDTEEPVLHARQVKQGNKQQHQAADDHALELAAPWHPAAEVHSEGRVKPRNGERRLGRLGNLQDPGGRGHEPDADEQGSMHASLHEHCRDGSEAQYGQDQLLVRQLEVSERHKGVLRHDHEAHDLEADERLEDADCNRDGLLQVLRQDL
mmetsp:Transcript_116719/g.341706  ORF Transcript_116719/g.341706 Transcript_116719/m.341706 type:complete len:371 (-) Transcript_116719:562-1674(-)